MAEETMNFNPVGFLGALTKDVAESPLPDGTWFKAEDSGDGLLYTFPAGSLEKYTYLWADLLLDGLHLAVYTLSLSEGEYGPTFGYSFGLLTQCSARMRMPLAAVNQNRWRYPRQGAFLKPRCQGERVDLAKVDRMMLRVELKSHLPVRWCQTPIQAAQLEPPLLEELVLPKGPILDELGQSTVLDWPTRTSNIEEVSSRLRAQLARVDEQRWPAHFSKWGGWREKRFEASGFFRTHHDGQRWWLVDPEGYAFWSAGMDCVRVDTDAAVAGLEPALTWLPAEDGEFAAAFRTSGEVKGFNYLAANFIRAFGPQDWYPKWASIALSELRRTGFNTVANWSDWQIAQKAAYPYVRPLTSTWSTLPMVYRDFPDVFHPGFPEAAAAYAEQLQNTADDPAFIGYFLMNEPTWGFAQETPAAGMLFNTPQCYTRTALSEFLQRKYPSEAELAESWGVPVSFQEVVQGAWQHPLNPKALGDLADFSEVMVEKFFGDISKACREVDPNHLNLGIRYYTIPPTWALAGMRQFDVFSMNCYKKRLPADEMAQISRLMDQPILIGEWHFGALDAGLPASGIGHVRDQAERGKAYRFYLEDAAAKPWCVGVHYFILYDQSAVGRFDGENYNIGFLDVCHRPYEALCRDARTSHERMYPVADGQAAPYADEPHYLPLLFM